MGEVYRAHDTRLGRDVALKVLPPAAGEDPDRVRRFELEARATAALSHPNILAVYDVGRHEDTCFLVTELLEGESLQQRMLGGTVTVHEAVELAIQTAHAVSAAHAHGIVHRDLKPGNLFITRDGRLKVLDFGLARLVSESGATVDSQVLTDTAGTATGAMLGTVGYMAPEQARGEAVDARTDIFALGVVLYEMLARRSPFARATGAETLTALLRDDPPPLSSTAGGASPALARIVERCLAKRPEERFQSAHDLALALEAVSSPGRAVGADGEPRRARRRAVRPAVVAALVVLAAVVGTLALRLFRPGDTAESPRGEPVATVAPRPPQKRVAILPFVNKTGSPDNDALGQAVAARVWSAVADVADVDLVAMATVDSVLASDRAADPASAVGEAVNAGVVVTGSVLADGGGQRIQAVVRDMVSSHLRPPAEVACPSVGDSDCVGQLALKVAEVVELQLHEPELLLMLNRLPSHEAYRTAAVDDDLERGIEIDPAIGIYRRLVQAYEMSNRGEDADAKATAQALLDDHRSMLSEYGSHCIRGTLAFFEMDYALSLHHYRQASELEPSSFFARSAGADAALACNRPLEVVSIFADIAPCDNRVAYKLVNALLLAPDFEGALDMARVFHACYPNSVWMDDFEIWALAALGRGGEMEQVLERRLTRPRGESFASRAEPAVAMSQASLHLRFRGDLTAARSLSERAVTWYVRTFDEWRARENAEASVEQEFRLVGFLGRAGRETEALELCRRLSERDPDDIEMIAASGILAVRCGDRESAEEADALLAAAGGSHRERYNAAYNRSCIAAQLGDIDRALDLVREAVAVGFPDWELIRLDPDLEPLRDNPTFQEIVRPKG
jgi:TolB-like protein/tetratricopeptide (TPR) repeat protein